jgi:chromosome segregation ATPase
MATGGVTEVLRRFFRRPLTDGQTEMLGSDAITERVGNEAPVTVFDNLQSLGLYRIRQDLERTLENSAARTDALTAAYQNAVNQLALLDQKEIDLKADQTGWDADLKAADRIEASVKDRYEAIDAELQATEDAIVLLGQQLRQMTANVTAEIDRRTPPPDLLEAPPAAGASVQ